MEANKCHICSDENEPLVRPCTNISCKARAHSSCLAKRSLEKCKECGSDIVKRGKFDRSRCLKFFTQQICLPILTISIYLLYLSVIISLSSGKYFPNIEICPTIELEPETEVCHNDLVVDEYWIRHNVQVCHLSPAITEKHCERGIVINLVMSFLLTVPFLIYFLFLLSFLMSLLKILILIKIWNVSSNIIFNIVQ